MGSPETWTDSPDAWTDAPVASAQHEADLWTDAPAAAAEHKAPETKRQKKADDIAGMSREDFNAMQQRFIKETYGLTPAQKAKEFTRKMWIAGGAGVGGVGGALLMGGPTLGAGAIPGALAGAAGGGSLAKVGSDVVLGPSVPDTEDYAKQYNLADTVPKTVAGAQLQMLKNTLSPKHMARSVEGLVTFPAEISKTLAEKGPIEGSKQVGLEAVKMLPMVYDVGMGDMTFENERRKLAEGTILDTAMSFEMGVGAVKAPRAIARAGSNRFDKWQSDKYIHEDGTPINPRDWNPNVGEYLKEQTPTFQKAGKLAAEEATLLKNATKDAWTSVKSKFTGTTPPPETLNMRFRDATNKFMARPTGKRVRTTMNDPAMAAQDIRTRNAMRETLQLEKEGNLRDSAGNEIPSWRERTIIDEGTAAQAAYDALKSEVLAQTAAAGAEPISMKPVADQLRAAKSKLASEDTAAHAAIDRLIEQYDLEMKTPQELENTLRHFNAQTGDMTGNLSTGQKQVAQVARLAANELLENIISERLGGDIKHRDLRQRWGDMIEYRDNIAKQVNRELGKQSKSADTRWDTVAGLEGIWALIQHSPKMMAVAALTKGNAMRLRHKFGKDANLRKAYRLVDDHFYTPRDRYKPPEPQPAGPVQQELPLQPEQMELNFDTTGQGHGIAPPFRASVGQPPPPRPVGAPEAYEPAAQGVGAGRPVTSEVPLEPRGAMPEDAVTAAEFASREPVSEVSGVRPPIEPPAAAAQGEVPPPRGTIRGEVPPALEPNAQTAGEGALDIERGMTQGTDYLTKPTERGAEVTERVGAPPISDFDPTLRDVGGPKPADITAAESMVEQLKAKQGDITPQDIGFLEQKLADMGFSRAEIKDYVKRAAVLGGAAMAYVALDEQGRDNLKELLGGGAAMAFVTPKAMKGLHEGWRKAAGEMAAGRSWDDVKGEFNASLQREFKHGEKTTEGKVKKAPQVYVEVEGPFRQKQGGAKQYPKRATGEYEATGEYTPTDYMDSLVADPAFMALSPFDRVRIFSEVERAYGTSRTKEYKTTQSLAQNQKLAGSNIVAVDTIRGCTNNCPSCFANSGGGQGNIAHTALVPQTWKGKLDPKKVLRVGEVGDPATDWSYSNGLVRDAIENSPGASFEKNLFAITKLQDIKGFDPTIWRNLEVSLDPLMPDHMAKTMANIKAIKALDPSVNIVVRVRSFKSTDPALMASQQAAVDFANANGLEILETKLRFKNRRYLEAIGLDPSVYKPQGAQLVYQGESVLKDLGNKKSDITVCGEGEIKGRCLSCRGCEKLTSKSVSKDWKADADYYRQQFKDGNITKEDLSAALEKINSERKGGGSATKGK